MDRYAPGGDIYQQIAVQYGVTAADRVQQAHESGRSGAVAEVLAELRLGPMSDTSTASIFWKQITTDPFAAPFETANRGIGTVLGSAIKGLFNNPWVLLLIALALVIYFWPLLRPLAKRITK